MKILGNDALVLVETASPVPAKYQESLQAMVKERIESGDPIVMPRGTRLHVLQWVRGQMEVAVIGGMAEPATNAPAAQECDRPEIRQSSPGIDVNDGIFIGLLIGVLGTIGAQVFLRCITG